MTFLFYFFIASQLFIDLIMLALITRVSDDMKMLYPLTLHFKDFSISKESGEPIDQITVAGFSTIRKKNANKRSQSK